MALQKVGALWNKTGKNGEFQAGSIELNGTKTDIMVFKNTRKDKPSQPDYQVMIKKEDEPERAVDVATEDVPF